MEFALRFILVAAAAVVVAALWPHRIALLLKPIFPQIIWDGEPSTASVSLTFDDGPDPVFTPQILETLKRYNIKATFFLVGERARRYPDQVRAIRALGHEIGNHTDSWRRTIRLSSKAFEIDLLRAEKTLEVHGARKLFRPAGILIRPEQLCILHEHNYVCVLGTGYAFDPYRPPSGYIRWVICRAMRPGAIIVLHESGGDRSRTVDALGQIIPNALSRGLRFCTVSETLLSPLDKRADLQHS
jgi:peptidoglycan/xylan/chitin deacetylase (PgdA/CDA1 family)